MIQETRIKLGDTTVNALSKMAGGNPGAITVVLELLKNTDDVDNAFGGFGSILNLDSFNIYEEKIWMLYKDICKENITHMVAILRSVQLGFISKEMLHKAINSQLDIDVESLINKVKLKLPNFEGI